ncbi:MAG: hypothetical protein K6B70_01970 [Clostridia bacterium]|nr:hypothetical protein [Clostridia bacterium]
MDINKMRNMVILKDLPSNLIEEALIVFKENQKIKKVEYAESKSDKFSGEGDNRNENDYVVKEAELLISDYINKLENYDSLPKIKNNNLLKKYKLCSIILGCLLFITCSYILFII